MRAAALQAAPPTGVPQQSHQELLQHTLLSQPSLNMAAAPAMQQPRPLSSVNSRPPWQQLQMLLGCHALPRQ